LGHKHLIRSKSCDPGDAVPDAVRSPALMSASSDSRTPLRRKLMFTRRVVSEPICEENADPEETMEGEYEVTSD